MSPYMMDFPMESGECKAQSVNPGKWQHRHLELMLMPMLMHSHLELFALSHLVQVSSTACLVSHIC